MGLDMWLLRKDLCKVDSKGRLDWYVDHESFDKIPGAEVAYWRKANQVHKWFVDNVQGGVDDCGYYPVPIDKLMGLLEICTRIVEHPEDAPELLPTQSGFFFGSYDYDDYYMEDIYSTLKQVKEAFEAAPENAEFVYTSSW